MKKIFFIVALAAIAFVQNSFAQDTTVKTESSALLSEYFKIKDALVAGKGNDAALNAAQFVKVTRSVDVPEENKSALLKIAGDISASKDIKKQREYFAVLSDQMIAVAKVAKLGHEPIYKVYCPMRKASWLSSQAVIKNPYYGSAMLTCGKVVETIQ